MIDETIERSAKSQAYWEQLNCRFPAADRVFDEYILETYKKNFITENVAMAYASHKDIVGRGIDFIKSSRGEKTTGSEALEIDHEYEVI